MSCKKFSWVSVTAKYQRKRDSDRQSYWPYKGEAIWMLDSVAFAYCKVPLP